MLIKSMTGHAGSCDLPLCASGGRVLTQSPSPDATLEAAHQCSMNNRAEVLNSELCGCFYCLQTFPPSEVEQWTDEINGVGTTAVCPRCGIDSVIGSRSGFALAPAFLKAMHDCWHR